MSINISFDISSIEKKIDSGTLRNTKVALANQILMDNERFVPRRKGDLVASGHTSAGGESVIYNTVYARAHYYGTNGIVTFRKYTTAGTGKKWADVSSKVNMDKWEKVVKKGLGLK